MENDLIKEYFETTKAKFQNSISPTIEGEIIFIKTLFRFKDDFDIKQHLVHAAAHWHSINQICKSVSTNSQKRKEILKAQKHLKSYIASLESLSKPLREHFDALPNLF